jgi:hypothetical protein
MIWLHDERSLRIAEYLMMECTLTALTCGRNATGLSAMFSIEKELYSSNESTILSRCLVNVGDTTQRFCGENRIKLSRVCCIILTSLAPHNVSGLPGILLCLSNLVGRSNLHNACFMDATTFLDLKIAGLYSFVTGSWEAPSCGTSWTAGAA